MSTLTPHLVVRDVERAARWYAEALGAEERGRIPLPGGKVLTIELAFGDSTVMIAEPWTPAPYRSMPWPTRSGANDTARSSTRTATAGASPSISATSRPKRLPGRPQRPSAKRSGHDFAS